VNTSSSRTSGSTIAYWTGAVALVALGSLALFSIGAPLLLTGAVMMVLSPWRKRPLILWPALIGLWSFVAGYVLVAPLSCTTSSGMDPVTVCTHVFGIHWYGRDPGLRPAFISGLTCAVIGVALALRVMVSRRRGLSG
jgi:hypothetical protein